MHEDEVAHESEHDERYRQHHPCGVRGDRVRGVRDDGRRGDDREQTIDEPQRVALEDGPSRRLLGADEDELPAALRETEEERQ